MNVTVDPLKATTADLPFPEDFVWGVATSAYQIEGSVNADGRGRSIWDTFSHSHGATHDGDTGDIAVDHYRRYLQDIRLMEILGMRAYRFSVSWPRVLPDGRGSVNQRGLDFYRRLADALQEAGIQPVATLYHWDLPQSLQDEGGWVARSTAEAFARYAEVVAAGLGGRVESYITLNEPWCSAFLGYASGVHAPGIKDPRQAAAAAHHLLLGHGLAVPALRSHGATDVAITLNLFPVTPAGSTEADLEAARAVDGLQNRLWLDPVLTGAYPDDVQRRLRTVSDLSHVRSADLDIINAPLDALGVNYYTRHTVMAAPERPPAAAATPWVAAGDVKFVEVDGKHSTMGWAIDDSGLLEVLLRLKREYPPIPLKITENGVAFDDVEENGRVDDVERIAYIDGHLRSVRKAIDQGVDVRAYFVWSLLDNFEWSFGYSKRFGLVYVNFESQSRIPKSSASWYRNVIAQGGLSNGDLRS